MNKFTSTSLKFVIFSVFLAVVGVLLLVLFIGPCYRTDTTTDDTMDIPAVIYLSDTDLSASDMSASDVSVTDISVTE